MSVLKELEEAVDSLSEKEYEKFRKWFLERDWQRWDQQIEEDSKNGNLDFLIKEAEKARNNNNLRKL